MRDAAKEEYDAQQRAASGRGQDRRKFLADAKTLKDLGVSEFNTRLAEKEDSRRMRIHLLPMNEDDPNIMGARLFIHYSVGEEQASILCPMRMAKWLNEKGMDIPREIKSGRCPICEEHDRIREEFFVARKDGDQEGADRCQKQMQAMRSHGGGYKNTDTPKSYLVWCVDKEDEDSGVRFYLMQGTVFQGLTEQMYGEDDEEFRDAYDQDDGFVFSFKRTGQQLDTRYSAFKLSPRRGSLPDEWYDDVPRFMDVLVFHDYETIEAMMGLRDVSAQDDEEEEEDDVKEELGREFDRTKNRRSRDDVPDDEDEDDEDDFPEEEPDEDEEDNEPEDDPEEDDEEDDEEEEEPEPEDRKSRVACLREKRRKARGE